VEAELLDSRATRLDDGVVAVALFGGFAFDVPWLLILVAISTALGAVFGLQGAPVVRGYHAFLASRVGPPGTLVDPAEWRFTATIEAVGLAVAAMLVLAGPTAIGWGLALIVAVASALDVTTGISVGAWAYRRWGKR